MTHLFKIASASLSLSLCLTGSGWSADAPAAPQAEKKVFVILLGGQSNAAGWGYHQHLLDTGNPLAKPQEDVELFSGTGLPALMNRLIPLQSGSGVPKAAGPKGAQQFPTLVGTEAMLNHFGPELTMGRTVRDMIKNPEAKVAVIKHAIGASNLYGHWRPDGTADSTKDGPIYKGFHATVKSGLAALQQRYPDHEIEIIGMGWVQGESDATAAQAANYEKNLTTFIQDIRATYGNHLVFALSKLSPNQPQSPEFEVVRAAQQAAAAKGDRVVATETVGENYPTAEGFAEGALHYRSAALLQIGKDLAQAIMSARAPARPPAAAAD
jgi:hypothetical protein